MQRRLIINADDFGWDSDATLAILALAENNKITSTTIMAGRVEEKELNQLKSYRHISTGIHINLISGRPISSPHRVSSLIDHNGEFYKAELLFKRFLLGKIKHSELEVEIINQLTCLKKYNLKISHADSHKHIHQFPFLGPIIIQILKQQGINKIRNCNILEINDKRMFVVNGFNRISRLFSSNYLSPELLITSFSNHKNASLSIFNKAINEAFNHYSTVEFMTHPALNNKTGSYLNRQDEYLFWMNKNLEPILTAIDVKLINYNDL